MQLFLLLFQKLEPTQATIGISIPELVILRKVLKMPMIWLFIGIMALGIILVGYLFNIIL
jgi:uncharacterized membrane protein YraQ (UPF0718 family)